MPKIVYKVQVVDHKKKVIWSREFNPVDLVKLLQLLNSISDWETLAETR